jgi:threonine aldolase
MKIIDLRSDTVSQPTPAMRQAMAAAEVGDDVYGEDPSINRLQELSAHLMGKEAGLFIPSGTMGNLIAVLVHCGRGDEVILGTQAHTFLFEAGGISALGGVHSCQIPNQADGTLDLEDIRHAVRPNDPHHPITRLITIENTHNRCGGVPLSASYTQAVSELARDFHLRVHLDGARIFNAAVAQRIPAKDLTAPVDSVTFCLSKGLCAPVGSVLCGSHEFINRAHRIRKQLGGGMRQAGILAAAGIIALETMIERLEQDHQRAKKLANLLGQIPGLQLDPGTPYTNMIFLKINKTLVPYTAAQIADRMSEFGIKLGVTSAFRFRLVTHYWIDDQAIEFTAEKFAEILKN